MGSSSKQKEIGSTMKIVEEVKNFNDQKLQDAINYRDIMHNSHRYTPIHSGQVEESSFERMKEKQNQNHSFKEPVFSNYSQHERNQWLQNND